LNRRQFNIPRPRRRALSRRLAPALLPRRAIERRRHPVAPLARPLLFRRSAPLNRSAPLIRAARRACTGSLRTGTECPCRPACPVVAFRISDGARSRTRANFGGGVAVLRQLTEAIPPLGLSGRGFRGAIAAAAVSGVIDRPATRTSAALTFWGKSRGVGILEADRIGAHFPQ